MATTVYDENGRKYILDAHRKLGEGGQGAVYRVPGDKKIAIKTFARTDIENVNGENNDDVILSNDEYYEKLSKKVHHIMAIDAITNVSNLATPIAMLRKPFCGYVMRFMNDMENISFQMRRTEDNIVSFVGKNTSLHKKYMVLYKLAEIISELNSKGLVYCDFSPANVFISKSKDSHEVWLIDTDNLHFAGKSTSSIGTPRYRAPEIAKSLQLGNTFYSDIYSYALLAYEYLTLSTPFYGSLAEVSIEDAWDAEDSAWDNNEDFEVKAEFGEVDYVYEGKDNFPIAGSGIPPQFVFTEEISNLFFRTFGKVGRDNPESRPLAEEWKEAFRNAAYEIMICSNYHTHLGIECKWCKRANSLNPERQLRDQNRYFELISTDFVYGMQNDWENEPADSQLYLYEKQLFTVSHRKDGVTSVKLPKDFLVRGSEFEPIIKVKSSEMEITMDKTEIYPSRIKWNYKEDTEITVVIYKNKVASKLLTLKWINNENE